MGIVESTAPSLNHVKSVTCRVHQQFDPVVVGVRTGILWSTPDLTLAGVGEALRIPIKRSSRGHGAAEAQQALGRLIGPDEVSQPGSGPIAFAAFPFNPDLEAELIVPEVTFVSNREQGQWVTVVDDGELTPAEALQRELDTTPTFDHNPPSQLSVKTSVSPAVWRDSIVSTARDRIVAGDLTKVVLARELLVAFDQPIGVQAVLEVLLARNPAATIFAFDGFVGASPELLVSRKFDQVQAHPLAGTVSRAADPLIDERLRLGLLASTKDQWEHQITIDWLLEELLPYCSYVDADPDPSIVSLPSVHHLGTRVEGRLSSPPVSVLELVAALHPTPAVGGSPQPAALALIAELERVDRGRYAGPMGWVDGAGNGAFNVAIRSAQIRGSTASLFAGAGVVADSDPGQELAETRAKFEEILASLIRL